MAAVVDTVARDYGCTDMLINYAGFAMAGFAEAVQNELLGTVAYDESYITQDANAALGTQYSDLLDWGLEGTITAQ